MEWGVAPDEDAAEALAIEMITQDLEEQPEIFTQSWLEGFINEDKLRRVLMPDVIDMRMDSIQDDLEHEQNLEAYANAAGIDLEDFEDEEGDLDETALAAKLLEDHLEDLAEQYAENELEDPLDWLRDIYGDEAMKKAMEWAGFDVEAAAKDAVLVDGVGHFLASYDGELRDLPSGGVYWRHN